MEDSVYQSAREPAIEQIYFHLQYQKFTELVSQIGDQESIPTDQIVLMFKDKAIATSESPESIEYIQGLVLSKTK